MRWGKDAQGLNFEGAMPGIKFALGENVEALPDRPAAASAATPGLRYPATRMGVEDVIREAFTEAQRLSEGMARLSGQSRRGMSKPSRRAAI